MIEQQAEGVKAFPDPNFQSVSHFYTKFQSEFITHISIEASFTEQLKNTLTTLHTFPDSSKLHRNSVKHRKERRCRGNIEVLMTGQHGKESHFGTDNCCMSSLVVKTLKWQSEHPVTLNDHRL